MYAVGGWNIVCLVQSIKIVKPPMHQGYKELREYSFKINN